MSYLRDIGRKTLLATSWAWSTSGLDFFGVSRLIMLSLCRRLDEQGALHHARCPQIPVPALDWVLLHVAVAAEQLYAFRSDPHPLRRAHPPRERGLVAEIGAVVGARCRPVG